MNALIGLNQSANYDVADVKAWEELNCKPGKLLSVGGQALQHHYTIL
jgi:hypothetical protein